MSDDSSAASSGDEMLKMSVPFSQESARTASPEKSSGKGSRSDGGGTSSSKSPKRKHEEIIAIESMSMDADEMEEKGDDYYFSRVIISWPHLTIPNFLLLFSTGKGDQSIQSRL